MEKEESQEIKENSIKIVYGKENLKDIITNLMEKTFIEKINESVNE
jgi:hypothetical protein